MHINIEDAVRALTLAKWPSALFPASEATDDLASAFAKAKKKGIANPFVYWPVSKFLPLWAQTPKGKKDGEKKDGDKKDAEEEKKAADKRLDMVQWGAAFQAGVLTVLCALLCMTYIDCWQAFALASVAVGMWDYHQAMAH